MSSTSMGMFNPQFPQFNGKNYDYWAITMRALFACQYLWEIVQDGFEEPANENEFNRLTQTEKDLLKSNRKKDSKALVFLYQAVDKSVFPRIGAAKTSKEALQTLKTAYQGMEKVKTTKLQLPRRDFENLCMKESDNIDSFFIHVIGLVTQMRTHGEVLEERRIVEKFLRVLPSKFDVIVTTIKETKDLSNFSVDELHASLITHEQRLSRNENSSLEQAFKIQMSFGRGRGQGRGNKRGRGRSQNRGRRNSPANAQGRGSNPNQNQGQGSSQQRGQHHAQGQRGGEYISKEFLQICRENGIHKQFTARYTPQQNGVAEKKNRAIMDMARSMLKAKHLPNEYWAKAVNCVAYILNRCPTKAMMNKVPEEAWSGRKQGVTHMRVFGCVGYAHIPDQLRRKLDSKGEKCIFIGYREESKEYMLYIPSTKNFFVSRDAQFIEEEAWDGSIEKTVNVKNCLSHDEDDEEMAETHPQTALPTQGQQATPLRINGSASPSTPQSGNSSASSSTCTPNERSKKFRNLSDIYEQEAANEGMNSLFALYCHVDDPIHFEDAIKDKKLIEAMTEEMNAIERNKTWELVELPKGK
eukprot:PITA_20884